MKHRVNRIVAAAILGVGLVTGSYAPAYAAPAWSLPAQGVQLDRAAKQAYVTDRMYTAFHKAQKTAPAAFTAPDGWVVHADHRKGRKDRKAGQSPRFTCAYGVTAPWRRIYCATDECLPSHCRTAGCPGQCQRDLYGRLQAGTGI